MKKIMLFVFILVILSSLASASLTDGLISYWSNDIDARDVHRSNHGTVIGATHLLTGILNGSYDLNRGAQRIRFTGSEMRRNDDFSVMGWLRVDTHNIHHEIFSTSDASVQYPTNWRVYVGTDNKVWGTVGCTISINNFVQGPFLITDSNWHHVAFVYDKDGRILTYVDGVLGDNQSSATSGCDIRGPGTDTYFGYNERTINDMDGGVDEWSYYNRTLTSEEVLQSYNNGLGLAYPFVPLLILNNLTVYYSFDVDSITGTNVMDLSRNGFNGTINGSPYLEPPSNYKVGNCHLYDPNDHIISSYNASLGSTFTMCSWVKGLDIGKNIAGTRITGGSGSIFGGASLGTEFKLRDSSGLVDAVYTNQTSFNWQYLCFVRNGTGVNNMFIYQDAILQNITSNLSGSASSTIAGDNLNIAKSINGFCPGCRIDEFALWNNMALNLSDIRFLYNNGNGYGFRFLPVTPILSGYNCTSCNVPFGDVTSPYTTVDTTPTFRFNTNVNSLCRIGDQNINYTSMGPARDCAGGQGAKDHVCTLSVQDELTTPTAYVYISCVSNGNETSDSSSGPLEMEVLNLSSTTADAIDLGIRNSLIWPSASVYEDQQVVLRNRFNNQNLSRVDRVAIYGNQSWLLNYAAPGEEFYGLFNISPMVYVLELSNMTTLEIRDAVAMYIDSTII